jgi:hypothetical protein
VGVGADAALLEEGMTSEEPRTNLQELEGYSIQKKITRARLLLKSPFY